MRYEEVLKKWLADQRTYQKYSTYTCYANIVENHLMPHLGQLEEVTTDIVQDFALRLLESGNRKGRPVWHQHRKHRWLKSPQ